MQKVNKYSAGRFLQALAVGESSAGNAEAYVAATNWIDAPDLIAALKTAVAARQTSDFVGAMVPVADSFLAAMRPYSVPLQLEGLRRVPMLTRVLANTARILASAIVEGQPIPVVRATWTSATLQPKRWAGIVVQTDELLRSTQATAALAIQDDLAQAVAEAENEGFISPYVSGSVLNGASNFNGSGSTLANVDTDLKRLVDLVPGAFRAGSAFVMAKATATYLGTLRGTGGGAAYPDVGPAGGRLLGLPVIITSAMQEEGSPPTSTIGLIDPGEILWADEGRVMLDVSGDTAVQMDGAPTNNSITPTATNMVSLYQTHSTATRAIRESSWYARSGAGAYFLSAY